MLKSIVAGCEELRAGHHLPRHRHLEPYAIVVLRGCFDQVSYAGRVHVRTGNLLVQPPLDCHANHLRSRGARILRLPWHDVDGLGGVYEVDIDAIARAAERDVHEAVHIARVHHRAIGVRKNDWPDSLAGAIATGNVVSLGAWAEEHGIARETVSRGFSSAYGVTARAFRLELRARDAWLRIVRSREPLAQIAAATGFADQAHMTRAVRALTGRPPVAWRTPAR